MCLGPRGQLTLAARQLLMAMIQPITSEELAAGTGLPLYRVRGAVRELVEAGLAEQQGDLYRATSRPEGKEQAT